MSDSNPNLFYLTKSDFHIMEKEAKAAMKKRELKIADSNFSVSITREQLYLISHNFQAYSNFGTAILFDVKKESKTDKKKVEEALGQILSLFKDKTEIQITEKNRDAFYFIGNVLDNPTLKKMCDSPDLPKTFFLTSQFLKNSPLTEKVLEHYFDIDDHKIPTSLWLQRCFIYKFFPFYFTEKGNRIIYLKEFKDIEILTALVNIQRGEPFDLLQWEESRLFNLISEFRLVPIVEFAQNLKLNQYCVKAQQFCAKSDQLKKESINDLKHILQARSLYIQNEDSLAQFLLNIYKSKSEALTLFEHLYIPGVKNSLIYPFIEKLTLKEETFKILTLALKHGFFVKEDFELTNLEMPEKRVFNTFDEKDPFEKIPKEYFDVDEFMKYKRENHILKKDINLLCSLAESKQNDKIQEAMNIIRNKDTKENRQEAYNKLKELMPTEGGERDPEVCWRIAAFQVQKVIQFNPEPKDSKELLTYAMEADIPDAYYWYGLQLIKSERFHYMKMAAMQDCACALYELGQLYYFALGVDENKEKGKQMMIKSAETGDSFCAGKVYTSIRCSQLEFQKDEVLEAKYKAIEEKRNFSDTSYIQSLKNNSNNNS